MYLPIDVGAHFARNVNSREAATEFGSWASLSVRFLDSTLRDRDFITGGGITTADIFAFGALDYGIRFAGFNPPPELKNLQSWFSSMAAPPSASA
jgi:glutathione S-transferase